MNKVLVYLGTHLGVLVLGALVVYLIFLRMENDRLKAEKTKAIGEAVAVKAAELGAVQGQLVSERALREGLDTKNAQLAAALAKVSKLARPVQSSQARVEVKETLPGRVDTPSTWIDGQDQYVFHLPAGPLDEHLLFRLRGVVIASPDGARFGQTAFERLNPRTGEQIASGGADVKFDFEFTKEEAASVSRWHPRVVALFGPQVGAGAGVQVNPWSGLILTGGGAYGKSNGPAGVAGVGWRLRFPWLDTTLGISALATYSKKGFGADGAATAELTR